MGPEVQPLSKGHRSVFFYVLTAIFFISLPFIFLYATGYRFTWEVGEFVGTGGMYVSVDRTGAEIYIDGQLVRETRVFRTAFYAQNLSPGTHRVVVQKPGHHTWVKQLPVYAHLVTEALAFNLPEVVEARVISPWRLSSGEALLSASSSLPLQITNSFVVMQKAPADRIADTEFERLSGLFTTPSAATPGVLTRAASAFSKATTTEAQLLQLQATTTKESNGVRLYMEGDDLFASFVGPRGSMPYYYCAEEFELTSASTSPLIHVEKLPVAVSEGMKPDLMQPVQKVEEGTACDPTIKFDRAGETVTAFDFFPGSSDLIVMARESGVFVVEVDDRAWQNTQPLVLGRNLDMRIENGNIYVADGELIYQIILRR